MIAEGIRIARSHVQCPWCKAYLRTTKDTFQCAGHGTYKTQDHLANVTGTKQYDFNDSTRRKGAPDYSQEYLPGYNSRKLLVPYDTK